MVDAYYANGIYGYDYDSGTVGHPRHTIDQIVNAAANNSTIYITNDFLKEPVNGVLFTAGKDFTYYVDSASSLIRQCYATEIYIANYDEGTVSIYDLVTNQVTATIQVGTHPADVEITQDGSRIYVANSGSNNVSVIDTVTRSVIGTVTLPSSPVGIYLSPSASLPLVVCSDGMVYKISSTEFTVVRQFMTVLGAGGTDTSAFGLFLMIACPGRLLFYNMSLLNPVYYTDITFGSARPICVLQSERDAFAYLTMSDNHLAIIWSDSLELRSYIPLPYLPAGMTPSDDWSKLYIACGGYVTVFDTWTEAVIESIPVNVGGTANGIVYDPTRLKVYLTYVGSPNVFALDLTTKEVTQIEGFTSPRSIGRFIKM